MNEPITEAELRAVVAVVFGVPAASVSVSTVVLAAESYARWHMPPVVDHA